MDNFNKKAKIFFIFLLSGFLLLNSCSPIHNKYRVPEKMKFLEAQLVDTLNKIEKRIQSNDLNKYYLMLNPMIMNRSSIGIYSYSYFWPHYTWYLTFMYDGKNVYFTNIDDSFGMHTFLDTCGFSKYKIRKFERIIRKIKKRNDEIHKSQTF
jgi:hypothetical protein